MQSIQQPKRFDYFQLLILSAIWGSSFLAIDVAIKNMSPFILAYGRIGFATLFLLFVVYYKKLPFPRDKNVWIILTIAGVINNAIPFFLISWGQQFINGSTAAIMLSTGPFVALVSSHFITNDEKFSLFKLLSVVLGFGGVFVLVGGDIASQNIDAVYGEIAVFCATLGYIGSGLLIRKIAHLNTIVCSTSMLLIATLFMTPFLFFEDLYRVHFTYISVFLVLYLAIVPTAIASLFRVKMVQRVGVQFMSQVAYLIPIFAIFWTWLFFSKIPSANAVIALILILSGLFIRRIKSNDRL